MSLVNENRHLSDVVLPSKTKVGFMISCPVLKTPLPKSEDCIDSVGKTSYVNTFDMIEGYLQVPLIE